MDNIKKYITLYESKSCVFENKTLEFIIQQIDLDHFCEEDKVIQAQSLIVGSVIVLFNNDIIGILKEYEDDIIIKNNKMEGELIVRIKIIDDIFWEKVNILLDNNVGFKISLVEGLERTSPYWQFDFY